MTFPNFTEKLEVKLEPEPEIGAVNHHGGNQNHDHHNNLDSDNLLEHLDDIMGDVINDEDLGIIRICNFTKKNNFRSRPKMTSPTESDKGREGSKISNK